VIGSLAPWNKVIPLFVSNSTGRYFHVIGYVEAGIVIVVVVVEAVAVVVAG
jgi:hypothetical protein